MFTDPQRIAGKLPRGLKAAALAGLLVLSALLTAVALRSPDHYWLAWISFLPLFVAVRWLRPLPAALAGGLWGAGLYLFSTVGRTPAIDAVASAIDPTALAVALSAWLLALLIVIPAVYVGLAARPARAIGFNLLILALGWTLIEAVVGTSYTNAPEPRAEWNPDLSGARADVPYEVQASASRVRCADHQACMPPPNQKRSAPRTLPGSEGEGPHLHWLARLFGYVSTSFLRACANGSLVGVLSNARLSLPPDPSLPGSPNAGARSPLQVALPIQSWFPHQAYPRGPPIQIAAIG